MIRLFFALLCLAATAWYLDHEQRAGRFQKVDEVFLDFMVANARERLQSPVPPLPGQVNGGAAHGRQPAADEKEGVVLVEMRVEDRAEYAVWPPPPLDWQTVLKSLHEYRPEVLLVASPLNWGRPTPDFVPAVAQTLLGYPSVVLGVEARLAGAGPGPGAAFLGDLEAVLPRFVRTAGDPEAAPALATLISAPDPAVRASAEAGLLCLRADGSPPDRLPYAVRDRGLLMPTALAQVLARQSRSPYTTGHRLKLGTGAGAYLANGLYVPLEPDGSYALPDADAEAASALPPVPAINALELMTGDLADMLDEADKALLHRASIIIVGITGPQGAEALPRLHARALQHLLSLPRLQRLPEMGQWTAWGLAGLGALWIVCRVRRRRALAAGFILSFTAFVISYLLFQGELIWCPPTLPVALLAVGTLLGRFLGRRDLPAAPTPPEPPAESAPAAATPPATNS